MVYVSTTVPKLLSITITGDTSISSSGCFVQFHLFGLSIDIEFFLLISMAYDRYVAICIPLHYHLIMSKKVCALLVAASFLAGFLNSLTFSVLMSKLSFYDLREINHFFCDLQTIMNLSCSDTTNLRLLISVDGAILGFFPFVMILLSYIFIISTILKIRTSEGRLKTFSSCSAHLTIVIIFYVTSLSMNVIPQSKHFSDVNKLLSLLYVEVVPMLNPLVYSLRNEEVLKAIKRWLKTLI
ncbi:olfactory receptor 1G1-like [Bombina bombina]|uniref:olfactory receptor 1G1-like n=1 Tax=Bombina bombina TaxID=8345 RepID=UPI00235AF801|nr:olfactory receptor 1G1-like [Bombina bombina]